VKKELIALFRYKPNKMDANNVFADLTWDDVVIEHGALKSIWEYPVKELKHKDLHTVCS